MGPLVSRKFGQIITLMGFFLHFFHKKWTMSLGKALSWKSVTEMSKKIPGQTPKGFSHRCPKSPNMTRIPWIKTRWVSPCLALLNACFWEGGNLTSRYINSSSRQEPMGLLNNQSMWAMIPVQLLHHEPCRHVSMSEILVCCYLTRWAPASYKWSYNL